MGYTHYFRGIVKLDADTRAEIKTAINLATADYGQQLIAGWDGKGSPVINTKEVRLNGVGDDSHETFGIRAGDGSWRFCKTARKPYDVVITAILLILADRNPGFDFSSDGNRDDWADGEALYTRAVGRLPVAVL